MSPWQIGIYPEPPNHLCSKPPSIQGSQSGRFFLVAQNPPTIEGNPAPLRFVSLRGSHPQPPAPVRFFLFFSWKAEVMCQPVQWRQSETCQPYNVMDVHEVTAAVESLYLDEPGPQGKGSRGVGASWRFGCLGNEPFGIQQKKEGNRGWLIGDIV